MNIVKELRKKKGIQQKELAIEIGVTQPTVSEWESGKKDPSGDRLKALAAYFDVDELVILGKGYADQLARAPVTDEAKIVADRLATACIIIGIVSFIIAASIAITLRILLGKIHRKKPIVPLAILSIIFTNLPGMAAGIVCLAMRDDDYWALTYSDL